MILSIYKFSSSFIFSKLCGIISLTISLCFIFLVLFFSDILLGICGVFFVSQIYHFISNALKMLVPFYFICFDNPALQIPFSIFSSVYFALFLQSRLHICAAFPTSLLWSAVSFVYFLLSFHHIIPDLFICFELVSGFFNLFEFLITLYFSVVC